MGIQPTLHPDVATFGFPYLGELHNAATLGTFERIVAEGDFDALTPRQVLERLGQGLQVEQRGLKAKCIQGCVEAGAIFRLTLRA